MSKLYTLKGKGNPKMEVEPSVKDLDIEDIEKIISDRLEDFEDNVRRIFESMREGMKRDSSGLVEKVVLDILDNRGIPGKEVIDSIFACPLCGRVYDWRKVEVESKRSSWTGKIKKHKDCSECKKAILVYEEDGEYWRTISEEESKKGELLKNVKHRIVYREIFK